MTKYRNPNLAVDIIIDCINSKNERGIVLIERKNPPYGVAIPGGFVDYGEALYDAAMREALEETSLEVKLIQQFFAYSHPMRDPRKHVVSVVFEAWAKGDPVAADDAKSVTLCSKDHVHLYKDWLVFDHYDILKDYVRGYRPRPCDEAIRNAKTY